MASKSGEKGKRLERDIKIFLNEVYKTEEFSRTPGSGAIMGQSNYQKNVGLEDNTKRVLGSDLICPTWFKFSVECKNYKDNPNHSTIITERETFLDYWLAETLFDSINLKQTPMLFFRTTRKGTFFVVPGKFFDIQPQFVLKYDCFKIIGIDHFPLFKDEIIKFNEENFTQIQEWLNTSDEVTFYLNNMLEQLNKGNIKNKNQAKISAVTYLIGQRNVDKN